MDKQSVMLLDGNTREALAMARCLGRRGITVFVGGHSKISRAFFSRYCKEHFVYPVDPEGRQMHSVILEHVKRFKPDVLIPSMDKAFSVVLRHQDEYRRYTRLIPLPEYDLFRDMGDKRNAAELAVSLGIPVPRTFFPQGIAEVKGLSEKLSYPVLVKPRVSAGGFGIKKASTPRQLREIFENAALHKNNPGPKEIIFEGALPLIQEYITGKVYNFFAYCEDHAPRSSFMWETLRNFPRAFGPGIAARSLKDGAIKDLSSRLIKSMRWNGILGIQYLVDSKDNVPKLIDINPRLVGTLEIALSCGIDFPFILFSKALDRHIELHYDYQEGKEFRWVLFGELFYWLTEKNKIKLLKEYCRLDNVSCEVSLSDLKPHLMHLLGLLHSRKEVR